MTDPDMLPWILEHGERVGVVTIILLGVFTFLLAWSREWLFLGKTVRRMLERETLRADRAEERNERLIAQLERSVSIAEGVANIAAVTATRRPPNPRDRKP